MPQKRAQLSKGFRCSSLGRFGARACSAGVLLVLGACGAGATTQAASTPGTPLLQMPGRAAPAERILGDVTLVGVPIGEVAIQLCPGHSPEQRSIETKIRPAALIRAVRSLGGRAYTLLSSESSAPIQTQTDVHDGDRTRTYRVSYGPGSFSYVYEKTGAKPRSGTRELSEPTPLYDLHASMEQLRAWKPRLDDEVHFFVVLGRHLWRVEARFMGPEMLTVRGTPRLTRRIEGRARRIDSDATGKHDVSDAGGTERTFQLWFDQSPQRVPVRLVATANYGDVAMMITDYDRSDAGCTDEAADGQ